MVRTNEVPERESAYLPQLLQLVVRDVATLTVMAPGFAMLFLPSIWAGPM